MKGTRGNLLRGYRATRVLCRQVVGETCWVSLFRIPSTLATRLGSVEMHALYLSQAPPARHVARVTEGEAGDLDYRCACLLAELVGIDLKDG